MGGLLIFWEVLKFLPFLTNIIRFSEKHYANNQPLLLQLQCQFHFNTFPFYRLQDQCIQWLWAILEVAVGWLVGIVGPYWWFLVITGNFLWFLMNSSASWSCDNLARQTIWHQDNLASDNLAPGPFGTRTIWHQDNLAPDQFGTIMWKLMIE